MGRPVPSLTQDGCARDARRGEPMADYTPVPCPQCQSQRIEKVSYTLWGGMIGPRLLNHVKCLDCKTTFNGKTGQSNARAIGIYLLVTFIIVFAIFYAVSLTRG